MQICKSMCNVRVCYSDYTTTFYDSDEKRNESKMSIFVLTPFSEDTLISYHPSVNILDLVVYVMSAIGAWFGFAFININIPAAIESWKKFRTLIRSHKTDERLKKIVRREVLRIVRTRPA